MRTRDLFIVGGILLALGAGCDDVEQAGSGAGTGPTGSAGTGTADTSATTSNSTTSNSATSGSGTSGSSVDTGSGGSSTSSTSSGSGGQGGQGQGGAPPQPDAGPDLPDGAGGAPPGMDAMPPAVDGGPSSITGKKGLWDLPGLLRIRATASTGALKPAYDALIAQAETAMALAPGSVMDKTTTPPSGDKHDYTGLARYFWPDPTKPNGLPYISRDGESNPDVDSNKYDYHAGQTMASSVTTLGLAYFLSRDEKYAQKAHDLLKVWYIDAATKMNPNLNYAQSVPGVATGRKEGIIDTLAMAYMIDSVEMLKDSPAFTAAEFTALNAWFTSFLGWLRTSAFGMAEEAAGNNHACYYDVQTMRYAIYLGNTTLASQLATMAQTRRISQINPDGSQPQEIARTKSLFYSEYNLTALFGIAQLSNAVGVNLFAYQSADGRSIRKAMDFLLPYADPAKMWPYPQIELDDRTMLIPLLRRAGIAYASPTYEQALTQYYAATLPTNIIQLAYPK